MLTIFIAHFKTKMYNNFRWCEMSKSTIIAVAGKGGVGKTSLSATIVRCLTEKYPDVKSVQFRNIDKYQTAILIWYYIEKKVN